MKPWKHSQHNKCSWKRYNAAWPFRGESNSDHAMPTAAKYSAREGSQLPGGKYIPYEGK